MIVAAAIVADWLGLEEEEWISSDPEKYVAWFSGIMTEVNDRSMPRIRPDRRRGSVYW